jgi:hypothetical protein
MNCIQGRRGLETLRREIRDDDHETPRLTEPSMDASMEMP